MLDVAEQYDVIIKSPIRSKLHRSRVPKVDKPTLTADQIKRVIDLMPDKEQLLCQLLAVTGMRVNEAQALRWMDFKRGTITTNHGLYRGKLQAPKTDASKRTIHLAPVVVGLLLDFREQANFQAEDDFIFCRADGSPHNSTTLRNHLRVAMRQVVNWEPRKFGFHIFRHSAGTLVYNQSRDLKLVQGTLGHSNIQTTANIYIHQSDKVRAEAGEYLAGEILAPLVTFEESQAS
jgi:integrase